MQSAFTSPRPSAPIATPSVDENYDLSGLNLRDPDAIMPAGETPFTINSRMYARNDGESRVSNRTRQGASYLADPVGLGLDQQNTATATGDITITNEIAFGMPFVAGATKPMPKLDIEIRKPDSNSTGHVMLRLFTDSGGNPSTLIGEGSILANQITTSYQYLSSYFIDVPTLNSGSTYWWVAIVQDNGTGPYYLHQTAASGGKQIVMNDLYPFTVTGSTSLGYSARFKTYQATSGGVQGFALRYPSTGSNLILFGQQGSIYSTTKAGAAPTQVDTGFSTTNPMRFEQIDDMSIWVDGQHSAKWWDGSTSPTAIGGVPSSSPTNVIAWKNRLFFMTDVTRVDFSDLSDFTSYPSVNFFYVPTPKSPDHMTGWIVFQDNLHIFTHNTKHLIIGSDISTFTRKEATGTKGAVSQEAIVADRNFIYFMAPDGMIYRWNGAKDELISDKMQPELSGIVDKTKVRLSLYRNQLRIYYPKAPSVTCDQMLLYDIDQNQWFMDTDHPVVASTNLYLDNQELIEFSSLVGQVFFGETQFSDLGKPLDWRYYTNYKAYAYRRRTGQTFGGGSAKKRIKRFRPIIRTEDADYTMLVGKDMDFANNPDMREYIVSSGGAKWGQFVWGDGTKWGKTSQIDTPSGMSGRGKHIQYRFQRRGVETPVELYGYIAQYKVGAQK